MAVERRRGERRGGGGGAVAVERRGGGGGVWVGESENTPPWLGLHQSSLPNAAKGYPPREPREHVQSATLLTTQDSLWRAPGKATFRNDRRYWPSASFSLPFFYKCRRHRRSATLL